MPSVPNFLPSRNAPLFRNGPWPPGTALSVTVPGLPPIVLDQTQAGFCGGMAFLTRDIFESGTPQLQGRDSVLIPPGLAHLLMARTMDAFVPVIGQWLHVTSELDHETVFGGKGLFAETVEECPAVTDTIDAGQLCPIGVVVAHSFVPVNVFQNHVELVYGYERVGDTLTLHVYDCNSGGGDPLTLDGDYIRLDVASTTPAKPIETNATGIVGMPGRIRGFFPLPYQYKDPGAAYIDSATALQLMKPPAEMAPQGTAKTRVSLLNDGSTTWTPATHHLASQLPLHNNLWGAAAQHLTGPVVPQKRATFDFTTTAPGTVGRATWAWQMVAGQGNVFGPQASSLVLVGAQSPQCQAIRDKLATNRQLLAELKVEKDSLNPRDPHELARIKAILKEMAQLNEADVELEHEAALAGCAL